VLGDFTSFALAIGDDSDVVIRGGRPLRARFSPLLVGDELSLELAGESIAGERDRGTCFEEDSSGACFVYDPNGDSVEDSAGVGLDPNAGPKAAPTEDVAGAKGPGANVGEVPKIGEVPIKGDFFFLVPKLFLSQLVALPMTLFGCSSTSTPPFCTSPNPRPSSRSALLLEAARGESETIVMVDLDLGIDPPS